MNFESYSNTRIFHFKSIEHKIEIVKYRDCNYIQWDIFQIWYEIGNSPHWLYIVWDNLSKKNKFRILTVPLTHIIAIEISTSQIELNSSNQSKFQVKYRKFHHYKLLHKFGYIWIDVMKLLWSSQNQFNSDFKNTPLYRIIDWIINLYQVRIGKYIYYLVYVVWLKSQV